MEGVPAPIQALASAELLPLSLCVLGALATLCAAATFVTAVLTVRGAQARVIAARTAHWTEHARHAHALRMTLASLAVLPIVFAILAGGATNPFAPYPPVLAMLLVWAAGFAVTLSFSRSAGRTLHGEGFRLARLLRGTVFRFLSLGIALVAPLAVGLSLERADARSFAIIGLSVFLLALWWTVGMFPAMRALGLLTPAPEAVAALVHRVAAARGQSVRSVWLVRILGANAFALVRQQAIAITEDAVQLLDESELEAVVGHELGHLSESPRGLVVRLLPSLALSVLLMVLRIAAEMQWLIAASFGALLVSSWAANAYARRSEVRADGKALEVQSTAGVYARALEKIAQANFHPVVLAKKRTVHPHTWDRLLAAGVTPDYPRPAPPPSEYPMRVRLVSIALLVSLLLGVALLVPMGEGTVFGDLVDAGSARMASSLALASRRRLLAGSPEDARALASASLALAESTEAHWALATALAGLGRCSEALEEAEGEGTGRSGFDERLVGLWDGSGCPLPRAFADRDDE